MILRNKSELASRNESDTEFNSAMEMTRSLSLLSLSISLLNAPYQTSVLDLTLNYTVCASNGLFSLKIFTEEPSKRLSITAI